MATTAPATDKKQQMQPKSEHKPQRRHDEKFKIFCGTANEALTEEICAFLGMERGKATVTRFSDGECYVQVLENVRGADVFVCQPTCFPVDEHIMELLLLVDALKRASARRITTLIPYHPHERQDRKDQPRVQVPSQLTAE